MAQIQLAHVGCGGMGLRHICGLIELKERGFDTFELAALCDQHRPAAEHVAAVAEEGLGQRPRIYVEYEAMLEKERGVDAVSIVVDTRMHHAFAMKALETGKHVAVEKPMGLTVRACRLMIESARRTLKVLSASENFRRDPMNRLVKAVLESGAIGEPRMTVMTRMAGGRSVQQVAAWRHQKTRGGLMLEYGVHTADLVLYFMGEVARVFAETHLWEPLRYMVEPGLGLGEFYAHRVREEIEMGEVFEATVEDAAFAVLSRSFGGGGPSQHQLRRSRKRPLNQRHLWRRRIAYADGRPAVVAGRACTGAGP